MLDAATGHDSNVAPRSAALLGANSPGDLVTSLSDLGKLKEQQGNHAEAGSLFRRAFEVGQDALAPTDPRFLQALTALTGYHVSRGAFDEAEPLLACALSLTQRIASDQQSELALLLNDLTRICLKHSAHALAEPLLMRLQTIKEKKGENHPELATVLASLASVRQALGQHESAEQLWRRVLDIREDSLAPNHFSLATALEHLAESCEARGKFDEALQLYQRAQTIRQLTLGNNHASLRLSRDRIADLQLQLSQDSSTDSESPSAPRPVSPADGFVLKFPAERRLTFPLQVPPTREPPSISDVNQTTGHASVEAPRSLVVQTTHAQSQADGPLTRSATLAETELVSYEDILLSIAEELGDEPAHRDQAQRARELFARALAVLLPHRKKVAIAGAVAVAILLGAWAWDSNAGKNAGQKGMASESPGTTFPGAFSGSSPVSSIRSLATTNDPHTLSPTRETTTSHGSSARNTTQERAQPTKGGSGQRHETRGIAIPEITTTSMAHFDSLQKVADVATPRFGESTPIDLSALSAGEQRLPFGTADQASNRPQRARLIGELPTPFVPVWVSGVAGEVIVTFIVDTEGRPVMSSFAVLKSPDATLSDAVRRVIPALRFEPARSGEPDAKRVADTVQVAYHFAPRKKP
jgi:tetratricopeptide (TPR) repeat protein